MRIFLMHITRRWLVLGLLLLAGTAVQLSSQQVANATASAPTVTFTLDFPASNPTHYSIAVDASGRARYESAAKFSDDSEEQTYQTEFYVSAGNRQRIFDWAKQAKYFAGKVDSGNRKLAFTGAKILSYQDGPKSNTAHYNYSNQEPVRELTSLFQNMAETLEYGRRLGYYHRYQKLALDEELKHMETQARNNELSEIQGVRPVLQEIAEDASVINVVRARAKELIQMGSTAEAGR
ncbi:MAG: hypothetical protein WAM78_18200 [Candidatus Sulfotelmatobacter sp.]